MRLRRCLVANRGEIAVRIIRACRELGIAPVAVCSEADARAQHVLLADESIHIGAAPAGESYLRADRLIDAALRAGCDCVHPGYGFLSESASFAAAVEGAGLIWVGPPSAAIAAMGSKTEARARMAAAGVPLVPGFQADDADLPAFIHAAEQIGYPVMVKAAGGGGGKGIRIVESATDLPEALAAAQREAAHAFGDPRVFLEKYIARGRHIEIQVLADAHGNVIHLGERDCSAQRRHQKVIEEAPAPGMDVARRDAMGAAAVTAARAVGYRSAGTVEFIVAPSGEFYFLEMNTRLQVEHPVTELVCGVDLVALQFAVADGQPLPLTQAEVALRGHAIECRLYAEDVAAGFLPAAGKLLRFLPPAAPGVRVDSGVMSGDTIGIHYDPLLAKVIVHARTREEALRRTRAALRETVVLGLPTNRDFLLAALAHPAFAAGGVDTGWITRELPALLDAMHASQTDAQTTLALIAAAVAEATTTSPPTEAAPAAATPWSRGDGFRL